MVDRKEWLQRGVNKNAKILEIGPSIGGIFRKDEGWNVDILDFLSQDDLKKRYHNGRNNPEMVEAVDFIATDGYVNAVGKSNYYDVVCSSHVIEHSLDLISTLNEYELLLKDNGVVRMAIPDKRYSCDYYMEPTSLAYAINRHEYMSDYKSHTKGAYYQWLFRNAYKDGDTYLGNSAFILNNDIEFCSDGKLWGQYLEEKKSSYDENEYIDFHEWFYTPATFSLLLYELNVLGYTTLAIDECIEVKNRIEFYVSLKKKNITFNSEVYRSILLKKKIEDVSCNSMYIELTSAVESKKDVFIFGAGQACKEKLELLSSMGITCCGLIVSNGHRTKKIVNGFPVYEISEILNDLKNGVVVLGVKEIFIDEVIELLEMEQIKYVW